MSVPRNLDDLLKDFNEVKVVDPVQVIEGHVWARRFLQHLRTNRMDDEEVAFKFLILTQYLQTKSDQEQNNNNVKKRQKLREDMKEIFVTTVNMFFHEDSEEMLCLSNAELADSIAVAFERLAKGSKLTDDDIGLVKKARRDPDVRQNGLDPQFMKFLSKTNPSSALACLLSIL